MRCRITGTAWDPFSELRIAALRAIGKTGGGDDLPIQQTSKLDGPRQQMLLGSLCLAWTCDSGCEPPGSRFAQSAILARIASEREYGPPRGLKRDSRASPRGSREIGQRRGVCM